MSQQPALPPRYPEQDCCALSLWRDSQWYAPQSHALPQGCKCQPSKWVHACSGEQHFPSHPSWWGGQRLPLKPSPTWAWTHSSGVTLSCSSWCSSLVTTPRAVDEQGSHPAGSLTCICLTQMRVSARSRAYCRLLSWLWPKQLGVEWKGHMA